MSRVSTDSHAPHLSLLCRLRTRFCAIPLERVVETLRPLPVEPLRNMPPFVLGLSVIRGVPVAVVDGGALFGSDEPAEHTRFITLKTGARYTALAAESVVGIWELPPALEELPPLLSEAHADLVSAIGRLDTELLWVLRVAHLVPLTQELVTFQSEVAVP